MAINSTSNDSNGRGFSLAIICVGFHSLLWFGKTAEEDSWAALERFYNLEAYGRDTSHPGFSVLVVKIIKRWKNYSEHPLNPTDISSKQEGELEDLESFQSISMVQAPGVVNNLLEAKAAELEEILPELLHALDAAKL